MQVYFKDETMPSWEAIPPTNINFVPMAIEAKQVGGVTPRHLLRLSELPSDPGLTLFSEPELSALKALIAGTSPLYTSSSSNTGAVLPVVSGKPVGAIQGSIWFDSVAGELKYHDGTRVKTVGTGTGAVADVTVQAPLVSTGGTSPQISIPKATASADGYLSASDWSEFHSKLSSVLSSGQILVGNGANVATAVTPGGDVALSSGGLFTVTGIQGRGLADTAPVEGQVLKFDAGKWRPGSLNIADLTTAGGVPQFGGASCSSEQTLTWNPVLDAFMCQEISIDAANIASGTLSEERLPNTVVLNGGNTGSLELGTRNSADLLLKTNDSTVMTISSEGNVGIGMAPSTSKLAVKSQNVRTMISTDAKEMDAPHTGGGMEIFGGDIHIVRSADEAVHWDAALRLYTYSNNRRSAIDLRRVRGTLTEPEYLRQNDPIGEMRFSTIRFEDSDYVGQAGGGVVIAGRAAENHSASSYPTYLSIFTTGIGETSPGERMRITSEGDVGIGTGAPDARLVVYNGSTTGKYTTSGWTHSSDYRLKTDIRPLENALEKILQLRGVSFKFKADQEGATQIGFIAQEVEPIFPEVVKTDGEGYKSMVYSNLVAPIVEAIKELNARLSSLKDGQASLASELESLKAENERVKAEKAAIKAYLCEKDPAAPFCR